MRRIGLGLAAGVIALSLATGTAPAAEATSPPVGGCLPVQISWFSGTITQLCAYYEDGRLTLSVRGSGLAQPIELRGELPVTLDGISFTLAAVAGLRQNGDGTWSGYFQVTQPFTLPESTIPVQVAPDGTSLGIELAFGGGGAQAQALTAAPSGALRLWVSAGGGTQGPMQVSLSPPAPAPPAAAPPPPPAAAPPPPAPPAAGPGSAGAPACRGRRCRRTPPPPPPRGAPRGGTPPAKRRGTPPGIQPGPGN